MRRRSRLSILGGILATGAAIALASTAGAVVDEFHSGATTMTYVTGDEVGETVFDFTGGTTKCKSLHMEGGYTGTTANDLTLTFAPGECSAFGLKATIDPNGCVVTMTTPTQGADNDHYSSAADVVCPVGKEIVITAGGFCTVSIPGQQFVGGIDMTNNTGSTPKDIASKWTWQGMTYTSSGGACGASGVNGKLTGEATLKAYKNAAHTEGVDFWISV